MKIKSVIGNDFWDHFPGRVNFLKLRLLSSHVLGCALETVHWHYTYTPEITLTLLNCFQINFQNFTLTLTPLIFFKIRMYSRRPQGSGAPGLHALLNYFGMNFRLDYTYTYTF